MITILMVVATPGGNQAQAVNSWKDDLQGGTMTSQIDASIQLTLGGKRIEETLNASDAATNPDESGKVLTEVATITVENTDSYMVTVSGNTNLTGESNSKHLIPSISHEKTLGSMQNEWGYYGVLGDSEETWNPNTNFKALTSNQQTIGTGGTTIDNITKKVTLFYGARVDDTIMEDFYGNTVTISVVAQPRTATVTMNKFNSITAMQEMTTDICKAASENDTAYLQDTRDNKSYWVTKLHDGNCWMSQNLDLNITTSNIKAATSDLAVNWTTSSTYPPKATTTSLTTGESALTGTYSWDLGLYLLNTPTATATCPPNNTGLSACITEGFINVSGWTPSKDPNFYRTTGYQGTDGITNCTKNANMAANPNATGVCQIYDAHYLVGNYYQWNAATAGTGGTIWDENAGGSICPKGWKLPDSKYGNRDSGSFAGLLLAYNLMLSDQYSGTISNGQYNVALSPLFWVRSGYIYNSSEDDVVT